MFNKSGLQTIQLRHSAELGWSRPCLASEKPLWYNFTRDFQKEENI